MKACVKKSKKHTGHFTQKYVGEVVEILAEGRKGIRICRLKNGNILSFNKSELRVSKYDTRDYNLKGLLTLYDIHSIAGKNKYVYLYGFKYLIRIKSAREKSYGDGFDFVCLKCQFYSAKGKFNMSVDLAVNLETGKQTRPRLYWCKQ